MTTLSELIDVAAQVTTGGCRWRRGDCDDDEVLDEASWLVAEAIMRSRCGSATWIFEAWRAAALNEVTDADLTLAEPFVVWTFGLPDAPGSDQHVQGHIAEVVWWLLAREEERENGDIVVLEPPDMDVTNSGGDGFIIFDSNQAGALAFELWEIKKRSSAGASQTIGTAYGQLEAHAERYLAKITSTLQATHADPEVRDLLGDLVPAWRTAAPTAGAGVALTTNSSGLPTKAFSTMHKHFPGHAKHGGGVHGCLIGLGDLAEFASQVQRKLWNGLSRTDS